MKGFVYAGRALAKINPKIITAPAETAPAEEA